MEVVKTWQAHFEQAGVTGRDIHSLSERIDGEELLCQRLKFDLVRYSLLPARRKKPSPFRSD